MKTNTPSILSQQEHSKVGSLGSKELSNLTIVPHKETSSSWVSEHLANAARVWVSADSERRQRVDGIRIADQWGAAVGELEVPFHRPHRPGRVAAGMDRVLHEGWATRYTDWQLHKMLKPAPVKLDKARRCAEIVF